MKTMRKLTSLFMALAMIVALAVTASAAENTGSIKINGAIDGKTYTAYRLLDVVAMSSDGSVYSYVINESWEGFFAEGGAGYGFVTTAEDATETTPYVNWSAAKNADIAQFAQDALKYAKDNNISSIASTKASGATAEFTNLELGYYLVDSSVGALCSLNITNRDITMDEKNSVPSVVKTADGKEAIIVQAGQNVSFQVKITVGKGAVNYKLHDKMSSDLSFNDDIQVSAVDAEGSAFDMTGKWEKLSSPERGDTLTISFEDGIANGTVITVTYSAKVTSDTLSSTPANNGAWVTYGGTDDENPEPTPTDDVKVYNAKVTVTKTDGEGEALENAGFVVKKLVDTTNGAYQYYKIEDNAVSWVNNIDDATEYKSDANGNVAAFTGLGVGTYFLEEKTVPAGYNKAKDKEFTVTDDVTLANLEQNATIENNAGVELPDTGGIGTTIFTVTGGVLMIGAAILFITKKRSESSSN